MKLNVLVLTLLMSSLITDVFSGNNSDDESKNSAAKKARFDEEASKCPICLQTEEDENGIFMTADQAQQMLTCTHSQFHQTCLTQALTRKASCPVCRQAAVGANDSEEEDAPEITLSEAVDRGNLEAVQALLAAGANVNAVNGAGSTPLHWAANRGRVAVIQALIDADADVNAADAQGNTPLHWSADYVAVVRALLAAGADKTIRNRAGQTAAQITRRPEIANFIRQYQPAGARNARFFNCAIS